MKYFSWIFCTDKSKRKNFSLIKALKFEKGLSEVNQIAGFSQVSYILFVRAPAISCHFTKISYNIQLRGFGIKLCQVFKVTQMSKNNINRDKTPPYLLCAYSFLFFFVILLKETAHDQKMKVISGGYNNQRKYGLFKNILFTI